MTLEKEQKQQGYAAPADTSNTLKVLNISATLNAKVECTDEDQIDPKRIAKIYDSMAERFLTSGLNVDAIRAQAQYYSTHPTTEAPMPLKYSDFPTPLPEESVRLCLVFFQKAHPELARHVSTAAKDIMQVLEKGSSGSTKFKCHLTKESHYHVTLFMTSQPHALRPDPFNHEHYELDMTTIEDISCMGPTEEVLAREIETMREVASTVPAPTLQVHRILLADSGTLLLCLIEKSPQASIYSIRKRFRERFPGAPPKQSTIYHASLGRIITPEQIPHTKREEIHTLCESWSQCLQQYEFKVPTVHHVRELQFTTVEGPSIALPFAQK